MAPQIVPLELLRSGEEGRVMQVEGEHGLVNRLAEMGLREGIHIRMVRPGSPCIVALDNQRLSFRTDEAALVFVEVT